MWAIFDPADFALHWAAFDLEAGDGEFIAAWCFLNCGIAPPTPDQRFVRNINVRQFGCPPDASNPIAIAGAMPAVFGAKLLACACGGVLYAAGVHRVLAGLATLYFFAAVLPWLHIFSQPVQ